jgi:imidazolonepropionase-like amidohydrolase
MHQLIEHAGLTPEEALKAVTRDSALALRKDNVGIIHKNAAADLIMWDLNDVSEIAACHSKPSKHIIYVIKNGIFRKKSLNPETVDIRALIKKRAELSEAEYISKQQQPK